MPELMKNYNNALQAIYDHVGFVEDWVIYPIDDKTDYVWELRATEVEYAKTLEDFNGDGDACYVDEIYTQRFYKKHVYRGEQLTLIFCDPGVDGMKYFRIFDNSKEVKENAS